MEKTTFNKNLKVILIIFGLVLVVSNFIFNDFSNKSDNISSKDDISDVKNDNNLKEKLSLGDVTRANRVEIKIFLSSVGLRSR